MNSLGLELIEHVSAEPFPEDLELSQTSNIAIRLMKAGNDGLKTAELFRGLHCSKYTSRLSELRHQGHVIQAERIEGSDQWRYYYGGYSGKNLKSELMNPLFEWMKLPKEEKWTEKQN